jgi:predicted phage terminase large subunit-like protein
MARARLQTVKASRPTEAFTEPLMDFIPRVQRGCDAPVHLKPYIDVLENSVGGDKRVVFAAPPQHGKTTATVAALVWWAKKHPHLSHVYATYSQDRAYQVSRGAQFTAAAAGLNLSTQTLGLWTMPEGGQILWTSVGGKLTGNPASGVVVVDDPISGPQDANSPTVRQTIADWFDQNCFSRRHPGTSFIVMATRWHQDDLSGTLSKSGDFQYINLKAVADDKRPAGDNREPGEALWPERRDLAFLEESRRRNPWAFAAMYQGSPVPRGGKVFKDPAFYTELPDRGYRIKYGVDLACTEKTRADWSVCVEIWAVPPRRGIGLDMSDPHGWEFYIVNVHRKQVQAPDFALTLKAIYSQHPASMHWYAAGMEAAPAQFMRRKGIPLQVKPPIGDKHIRSQTTAELWNDGRICVPLDHDAHPWLAVFLDEVTSFTGIKDLHDDQVDAMVAGIDAALLGGDDEMPERSGGRYV